MKSDCFLVSYPSGSGGHFISSLLAYNIYGVEPVINPTIGHCHDLWNNSHEWKGLYSITKYNIISSLENDIQNVPSKVIVKDHPNNFCNAINFDFQKYFRRVISISITVNEEDWPKSFSLYVLKQFNWKFPSYKNANYKKLDIHYKELIKNNLILTNTLEDYNKSNHVISSENYNIMSECRNSGNGFLPDLNYKEESFNITTKYKTNTSLNIDFKDIYYKPEKIIKTIENATQIKFIVDIYKVLNTYITINKRLFSRYVAQGKL